MKVLIPLLSENDDAAFIKEASESAKEIIILIVVDASPAQKFGFTTSQINKGEKTVQEARKMISKKKKIEDIIEWGETEAKIHNNALLRQVDRVVMKTQHNQFFEKLVNKLRRDKIEVELI